MTNEAIKALMILALYSALEITLFLSSVGTAAKSAVRSTARRTTRGYFAEDRPED